MGATVIKLGLLAGAAALSCLVSVPAHATAFVSLTSVTFDGTNIANAAANTAVFNFNGLTNAGVPFPGASATLTLTLSSIVGSAFNFAYSLQNTSSTANVRVTGIGFDVDPNVTGASSTGIFDLAVLGADFNSGAGVNAVELCFHGSGMNCPVSNANNSVLQGATGSGTLSLTFGSAQTSITLSNFLDRYQQAGGPDLANGYGQGTAVPEPATWAMMLVGFGFAGFAMRRRQNVRVSFA